MSRLRDLRELGAEPEGAEVRSRHPRLLADERRDMVSLFGSAVDLDRVSLRFGGLLAVGGYARTVGNTIAFPHVYRKRYRSLARRCWLAHELTHVWQNQVLGKRYMAGALLEHLTRRDPYHFELFPGLSFLDYGYEAQASLMAELYRLRRLRRRGPERDRLEELLGELFEASGARGPVA